MGSSFTNVQVYNGNRHTQKQVHDWLAAYYGSQGKKLAESETEADEILYYALHGNGRWVAVYNQNWEYDGKAHDRDMVNLSKELGTCTVGILVSDSDLAILQVTDGTSGTIDVVAVGDVDMLETDGPLNGNAGQWASWLHGNATIEQLQTVWMDEYVFHEDVVSKTGKLLGMEPEYTCVGYNYLEDMREELELYALPLVVADMQKRAKQQYITEGPTKLCILAIHGGNDGGAVSVTFTNTGGPSKGAVTLVEGEDLLEGRITVDSISFRYFSDPHQAYELSSIAESGKQDMEKMFAYRALLENRPTEAQKPEWTAGDSGHRYMQAIFKDFEFPMGYPYPDAENDAPDWKAFEGW